MQSIQQIIDAVYRKDLQVIRSLTSSEVNTIDNDGRTPLMHAILAENSDRKIVTYLLDNGADINAFDRGQQWTALHFAARDHKPAIVHELLERGAQVDPVDIFGNTPLWRAVMNSYKDITVIEELVKRGANPHKENKHGIAPIDIARNTGRTDIVSLFDAQNGR